MGASQRVETAHRGEHIVYLVIHKRMIPLFSTLLSGQYMVSADIKSITLYGHQDCETWIGASLVHINVFCNMAKYVCGFCFASGWQNNHHSSGWNMERFNMSFAIWNNTEMLIGLMIYYHITQSASNHRNHLEKPSTILIYAQHSQTRTCGIIIKLREYFHCHPWELISTGLSTSVEQGTTVASLPWT